MKTNLITAVLMTAVTTILLGLIYPFLITALAQALFPDKANGQIISRNGEAVGSRIIGQPFTGDAYFHSRPSAAGDGYDAANSNGSNLGPTSRKLIEQIEQRAQREQAGTEPVPIDLVAASASGLDPDISPAAAEYQLPRVAHARGTSENEVKALVAKHTEERQLGFLGEPRVNVVELNLELDQLHPIRR
jgi:K+-transporting ATPase ATPase C chain